MLFIAEESRGILQALCHSVVLTEPASDRSGLTLSCKQEAPPTGETRNNNPITEIYCKSKGKTNNGKILHML